MSLFKVLQTPKTFPRKIVSFSFVFNFAKQIISSIFEICWLNVSHKSFVHKSKCVYLNAFDLLAMLFPVDTRNTIITYLVSDKTFEIAASVICFDCWHTHAHAHWSMDKCCGHQQPIEITDADSGEREKKTAFICKDQIVQTVIYTRFHRFNNKFQQKHK